MDKITLSNCGTYKEIEYLKKTLGPVLVSALSEVCVKRPTDPIEFLGHWLLRWRYNEELKRRDMENALEVIRQRQTAKCEREQNLVNCKIELDPYGQGVIPNYPFLPSGYGGPVTKEDWDALRPAEVEEEEQDLIEYEMPGEDEYGGGYSRGRSLEMPGEDGPGNYYNMPYDPNQMQYASNQMQYAPNTGQGQYDPNEQMQYDPNAQPYVGDQQQQQQQQQQVMSYDTNVDPAQPQVFTQ